MVSEDELNAAAKQLAKRLNRMLAAAPKDDMAYMDIDKLDDQRRGYKRRKNVSSQRKRILDALKLEKRCGTDFLGWGIPRYSARIGELRADGHDIATQPCRLHHHETTQYVYVLLDAYQDTP